MVTGEEDVEQAKQLIEDIKKITAPGGFNFKKSILTRHKNESQELFKGKEKVLGIIWNPETDMLQYIAKVNPNKKKRGKKIGEDWQPKDINALAYQDLTRIYLVCQ